MTFTPKQATEEYQCPGCVVGSDTDCGKYKQDAKAGIGCSSHVAGTRCYPFAGLIFLGMPKGFTRTGKEEHDLKITVFENISDFTYNFLNVPTWKWKNEKGHVFVRGHYPRINMTFMHLFLSDNGYENIRCYELTKEDLEGMDG